MNTTISRRLLPCVLLAALGGSAWAQITSSQTSAVPSDSPTALKEEPTLAPNHNRGMGASSGATMGGSEAPATSGPPAQLGSASPVIEEADAAPRKNKAAGAGQRRSQLKLNRDQDS